MSSQQPAVQESPNQILSSIQSSLSLLEKCSHEVGGVCYESYSKGAVVYNECEASHLCGCDWS